MSLSAKPAPCSRRTGGKDRGKREGAKEGEGGVCWDNWMDGKLGVGGGANRRSETRYGSEEDASRQKWWWAEWGEKDIESRQKNGEVRGEKKKKTRNGSYRRVCCRGSCCHDNRTGVKAGQLNAGRHRANKHMTVPVCMHRLIHSSKSQCVSFRDQFL